MVKYTVYHKENKNLLLILEMPDDKKIFPMDVKDKACSEGCFPWGSYGKLIVRKTRMEDIAR